MSRDNDNETKHRDRLENQFRQQQVFSNGYSPLYACLFGIIADWLAAGGTDPLVEWLMDVSIDREPIDVTLLLPAALHREVLSREPGVAELARHYPPASNVPPSELEPVLRRAIQARAEPLAAFIRTANVQTNETGRGLAWLLPVACLGWPRVHLVELGASAGLNMVAERRSYRLASAAEPSRTLLLLGDGLPQFTTLARGDSLIPPLACCPSVLSRTGGDRHPFHLRTADDEMKLASFIWADQVERMVRLREGIAACRDVAGTDAPVTVRPLVLPDGLPGFLRHELPVLSDAPVVIFNTTVTMYLPDRGDSLRRIIGEWAVRQPVPVLWLQWELPLDDAQPPETGWLIWSADFWPNDGTGAARTFHLAWVHPHGTALEWALGWAEFLGITRQI